MSVVKFRDGCGGYAIDIDTSDGGSEVISLFFNYRHHAEMVKRVLEADEKEQIADVVELPLIIDTGYKVRIIRRDDYGNLYTTYRMTKREARDFLARVGELTEKAEKALAER